MTSQQVNILAIVTDPSLTDQIRYSLPTSYSISSVQHPVDALKRLIPETTTLLLHDLDAIEPAHHSAHQTLCRQAVSAGIPVVFLTDALDTAEPFLRDLDGPADILAKPISPLELRLRCANLVALREAQQQNIRSSQELRRLAEEGSSRLAGSEHRFRLMVDSIEDYAMFMVDLSGRITSWNRGAERLTGYSEDEALGQHFSILYPREALDEQHAMYELSTARQRGRYEEEGVRVRKDGSIYHAQITVWRVDDEHGRTVGFAKITRDVTARKQAEQALRESEAKFRTIADAMPQMVWSTRPDGFHDYYNEQWYQFTGVPLASTDGAGWNDVFHPSDQRRAKQAWQNSLATGEPYEIQYRLRHRSGEYRWTLGRALPVRDDNGTIVRWMGTCTDIHNQKQAEETLQEAARRKDEFLAMLAHELRNPLAPIYNSAQLINRLLGTDPKLQHALRVIDRQVKHMSRLIDDLLDVARISRGKIALRTEEIELVEILWQTLDDYRNNFQTKGIQLEEFLPSEPVWIQGDRTRIAQVIGNLLHNSLKFTETGGVVRLSLSVTHREPDAFQHERSEIAVITITDSGIGMDPVLLNRLFDPFTQGTQSLARSHGGLGLGLALVKGFVELHGGSIRVDSEGLGRGSEFTIELPSSASPVPVERPSGPAPQQPAERALRFVLIDDNRDMIDTLQELLQLRGHVVATAYDGEEGLAVIRAQKPDVIICDIGLPGALDGYEVARILRSDPQLDSSLLIALSGYGQEQDRVKSSACGFDMHMLKPLDLDELDQLINERK